MHSFSNAGGRGRLHRIAAAIFAAILMLCSLPAGAEGMAVYTVTSLNNSGPGTLRQAIEDANASEGDFKIVIAFEGKPVITSFMPVLRVHDRSGWIQSNPSATLAEFHCEIRDGGVLTLENAIIENTQIGGLAIGVRSFNPGNALILKGASRVIGSRTNSRIILDSAALTVDKAPGGTNFDSTLTLTGAGRSIFGEGFLLVKGGTLETHGTDDGISLDGQLWVGGGKLVATGGDIGISARTGALSVLISGGNIAASGTSQDIFIVEATIYRGGSMDARKFEFPGVRDSERYALYLVTVTVGYPAVRNKEVRCLVDNFDPFTAMTDEDGKLYLWMREALEGTVEINDGGSLYRASGTIQANYNNTMTAERVPPVVTGVTVTPSSATARRGSTVQFSATVEGLYNPSQDVTWTVENGHAGTNIDAGGLLTISAGETSQALLVIATSVEDTSFSDTAEIAVTALSALAALMLLLLFFIFLLALLLLAFL